MAQSAKVLADSLPHRLKEVEVNATQAPKEAVSSSPMHVIDQSVMQRAGVTDVSDAIHRMPGVNLRDYGGAGGLKTVSVRGFGAGHTGVFYDGVPLSDVQSGQIDLSRYSIDNVKSVSMVIGDNDDIFIPARMAASAATVSISTMPAIDRMELNAKFRLGSFGYYNPFIKFGVPISNNAAINLVGEFTHADNNYPFQLKNGDLTTTEHRNNSRMNSGHGEVNARWDINNRHTLTAKAYYYNNSRQLPGPVIYYTNVSHEHLRETNAMAQAQWRGLIAPGWSIKGIMKFNFASSFYHDENGKYPGGVLDQNYWQREYYTSWALLYAPVKNWMFDYSIDYFHNNLNSNLVDDGRPYRNSLLQSLTAKYKISQLTIMGRLLYSLYLNGAKQGVAAKNASKFSPSVSLSWQPMRSQLFFVRASYKNIFRMPTFNEAYFDHYGSADVLPESTDQFNIGATYTAKSTGVLTQATFSVDGYINNIKDMIVAVPYNMFIWSMVNLGKVRTVGVDATAEVTITPKRSHDLTLMCSYSFQRAMPRTNPDALDWMKQVAYIPKHSGSASISYENPWVNVSISGTGVSERYTTNENIPATKIDGYIDLGASVWRDFAINGHTLGARFDVLNLLNTQYCVVARYPMPGRQFRLTLSFTY